MEVVYCNLTGLTNILYDKEICSRVKKFFIFLIKIYQRFFSAFFGPRCRFYPTCSDYTIEAFQKKGLFLGIIFSAWRILRCNPWVKGGYDPVR